MACGQRLPIPRALGEWMGRRGWRALRQIQSDAFLPIYKGDADAIISASTASGKTEAAFLPCLSKVSATPGTGVRILYLSPLKALINDQERRLSEMAGALGIPTTPWHGDVGQRRKRDLLKLPMGVLLTTPESLEALLMGHLTWLQSAMGGLSYVVIDEFHAFLGTERGRQLQSELHRLENLIRRRVPRIALSATFSDHQAVALSLRPDHALPCTFIEDRAPGRDTLAVQVRGYALPARAEHEPHAGMPPEYGKIAADIFRLLRGSTNLVFCNSRSVTEGIAALLKGLSERAHVPLEFFPHHGSLAADLRERLEARLQEGRLPTTAVCTATLELGIDIKGVVSIAQVEPPTSVASLRQRLGRSGRRDHVARLRIFVPERAPGPWSLSDQLCEGTVLSAAMVNLLLRRWYEPPPRPTLSLSTLVQQTLSVIASLGSASAAQLHGLLCKSGTFPCDSATYAGLLRDLGKSDLIVQLRDGSLTLGLEGERLVSDWNFYAAFKSPDEYRIEHHGEAIGTVPLIHPLTPGERFAFAGKGWEVEYFSHARMVVGVKPCPQEAPPLALDGTLSSVHGEVREEMRRIYTGAPAPGCLDEAAREHLERGRAAFTALGLDSQHLVEWQQGLALFPWRSDQVHLTCALMLQGEQVKAQAMGSHLEISYSSREGLRSAVAALVRKGIQDPSALLRHRRQLDREKHDHYLSPELKRRAFAHDQLDQAGALEVFSALLPEL